MRGDLPQEVKERFLASRSTPHARGSTVCWGIYAADMAVYPACAGIYRIRTTSNSATARLPRMRGDLPDTVPRAVGKGQSTPHARGSTIKG